MNKHYVNTIILSDIHMGSSLENLDAIEYVLDTYVANTWIFNGDIFDFWKMFYYPFNEKDKVITKKHLDIISRIIELTNYSNVIYVTGNHDDLIRNFTPFVINDIKFVDKYIFTDKLNRKCCVIHGDSFDVFSSKLDSIAKVSDFIFHSYISKKKYMQKFAEFIIDKVKHIVNKTSNFNNKVIQHAIQNNYDIIICGHTHIPCFDYAAGRLYINSGDFVDSNSYITEEREGEWLINFIKKDRSHSTLQYQHSPIL
jgi:UDP-2,3-diacylglucosamine pyrophosphatase LpxH